MFSYNALGISIYQMQCFLAVAANGSFTKAAAFMQVTQSAVSKTVSALEMQLGLTLFIRESNSVQLTQTGSYLYEMWSGFSILVEDSIQRAHKIQSGEAGDLILGLHDSFGHLPWIQRAIDLFRDRCSEVNLRVEYDNLMLTQQISKRKMDIVIQNLNGTSLRDNDLKWETLEESPLYLVMRSSNPLAAKQELSREELKSLRYVVPAPFVAPAYSHFFNDFFDFIPNIAYFARSTVSILDNLCCDDEALIIDRFVKGFDDPKYCFKELPGGNQSAISAIWRDRDENPNIKMFLDCIRETVGAGGSSTQ